jgi:uncharacterized integral membrane protein
MLINDMNFKMKNKKAKGELEIIVGSIFFIIIIVILASSNVFTDIMKAFNIPEFGAFGVLLGILFILMIIIGIFSRIFEK